LDDYPGLAAAGAGEHQQGAVDVLDGSALGWVETVHREGGGDGRASYPPPVSRATAAVVSTGGGRCYQLKPAPPMTLDSPSPNAAPSDTLARLPMTRW